MSLNVNGRIVENKAKYINEQGGTKLTYNFVTDPRLKRGRNYGIVYVTSTAFDENDIAMKKLNSGLPSDTFGNENNLTNGTVSQGPSGKKSKKGPVVKIPTPAEIKTFIMIAQNKLTLFRNKKIAYK